MKNYSLQEAMKDLRNPKKTLKEDLNFDLKKATQDALNQIGDVSQFSNSDLVNEVAKIIQHKYNMELDDNQSDELIDIINGKYTDTDISNEPVNLDYHKGDEFLDMLWDRLSPQYKVASMDLEEGEDPFMENPHKQYVILPEAEYNDYAQGIVEEDSSWEEQFEMLGLDSEPLIDVAYKNGYIYLYYATNCENDFSYEDEDFEAKVFTSIDDLVSEILGL